MRNLPNIPFLNEEMLNLHNMIYHRRTGTPGQLAKKLGCCKRKVAYKINELKACGFPIEYSDNYKSYYYPLDFGIDIKVVLDGKVIREIKGGTNNSEIDEFNIIVDRDVLTKSKIPIVL